MQSIDICNLLYDMLYEIMKIHKGQRQKTKIKWYFWEVPTTNWPTPPLPSCGQTNTFFGGIFFCLESPDMEKLI